MKTTTRTSTRSRRFVISPDEPLPPLRYQAPRDDSILKTVYCYGEIPSDWLAELVPGSAQVNKRRFRKLFKHRYLKRIKQGNNAPIHYALHRHGYKRLAELWNTTPADVRTKSHARFKQHIYDHAHGIVEFRYALEHTLATRDDVRIKFWYADGTIREKVSYLSRTGFKKKTIIKDSLFGLEFKVVGLDPMLVGYGLERDRSTMCGTTKQEGRLFDRYEALWHLWQQGIIYRKYGVKCFVDLTICETQERAWNMCEMARHAGNQREGSRLFWFTSVDLFRDNPAATLEHIWFTPRGDGLKSLADFIPIAVYPTPSTLALDMPLVTH